MNMHHPYYAASAAPLPRRVHGPISPSLTQSSSSIDPSLDNPTFQFTPPPLAPPSTDSLEHYSSRVIMANHQQLPHNTQAVQHSQQAQQQQLPRKVPEVEMVKPQQQPPPPPPPPPAIETTSDQTLPGKDVTEDNIDSAYAEFILYCNPPIPRDVDTEELKKGFRNPPRSDGNSFSPWTIFHLLQKLERKEIKTWAHLVTELGVEPPDPEKHQSAQKVQQYAVRLKRWLHAYHIDSFFNYLASRPSTYYTERPITDVELAETVREGVPPEEDLAVRALLPEWRPKRGRRKADESADIETPSESHMRISGRPGSSDFSNMYEGQYSATPSSAWSSLNAPHDDVWTAAQIAIAPKSAGPVTPHQSLSAPPNSALHQRSWRFPTSNPNAAETPSSEYAHSATTPLNPLSAPSALGESEPKTATPLSAHPGSRSPASTKRKRHAPAISSAWNQGHTGGKIRGRPPSNRSIQDGPFGTFPVNPNPKDAGTVQNISASGISTVVRQPSPGRPSQSPPTYMHSTAPLPHGAPTMSRSRSSSGTDNSFTGRKPSKLQLQVPQHQGGPVRLATPPRVLVNGETQLHTTSGIGGRLPDRRAQEEHSSEYTESEDITMLDASADDRDVDWKRRCFVLMRKLQDKEEELKRVRRAVLDAVM